MKRRKTKKRRSLWHSAFVEAIQRELGTWKNALHFEAEHLLNAAPLALDLLIIKKESGLVIDNPVAAVFREHNILEYKSPKDYVSVFDFNKVFGYAYIYSALNEAPLEEITITFIEDHYPVKLFKYLTGVGYRIEKKRSGIYRIENDKMRILVQLIVRRQLNASDSLWLKALGDDLSAADLEHLLDESSKAGEPAVKGAFLDLVLSVNKKTVGELIMKKKSAWEEISEELGLTKEWEARGEDRAEARTAAEREQLRQENERLRQGNEQLMQEVEQLRARLGA
jgi:hypothetical protein